jgi:hypothetical protein
MLRPITLVFVLALLAFPQPTTSVDPSPTAEFPPQDRALALTVRSGFLKTAAADLLRKDPGFLDTLRALRILQLCAVAIIPRRCSLTQRPARYSD